MKNKSNTAVGEQLPGRKTGFLSLPLVKYLRKNWILYLFVMPTILWFVVFKYFPMPGIYMAFTRYKGSVEIFDAKFV